MTQTDYIILNYYLLVLLLTILTILLFVLLIGLLDAERQVKFYIRMVCGFLFVHIHIISSWY